MLNYRQRKEFLRLLRMRALSLVLALLAIYGCFAVWEIYQKERESLAQRKDAESQLREVQERKGALTSEIRAMDTDRGKEEALRGQYAVGKEGENLIIIVDDKHASSSQQIVPKGWLEAWLGL